MNLIQATLSDISALQQICREAYALNFHTHWEADGMEMYLEQEFNIERLKSDIANPKMDYFFINVKNLPIGFVKVNYEASLADFAASEVMELVKIYVLPRCKGMGYGRFALQEIIGIAKDRNKKILCLSVSASH